DGLKRMIGRTRSHYNVLEEISRGGMDGPRSLIGNHSTSMEATAALGCRYQLDRWDRETEQELTSASPAWDGSSSTCRTRLVTRAAWVLSSS
ncbi:MAG: hypothetical protein V3U22_03190, partial [Vicinamibacteria bacterium]